MELKDWHKACLEDLENTSLSYAEIGRKYGRARDTIIKLKNHYNVTRKNPPENYGQRKPDTLSSLSDQHRALGSRLTVFRANKTYSQVGDLLGVSRHIVKLMELGAHDFTLNQLMRISDVLGMEISQMIAPIALVGRVTVIKEENARK
jgi:hypothetical protein